MNKQRLLELAGITEAKQAGVEGAFVIVGPHNETIIGPFVSQEQARKYVQWEIEHFELEDEELHGRIEKVYPPEW